MSYPRGSAAEIDVTLRDGTGRVADPTALTLFIMAPDGQEETRSWPAGEGISRASAGIFSAVITLDRPGEWKYRWAATGSVETAANGGLLVAHDDFEEGAAPTRIVEFNDFRPSPRHDGRSWTQVRIDEAPDPGGTWAPVRTIELEDADRDPATPSVRSFTATGVTERWARLVFLAEDGEDRPCPCVHVEGVPFMPTPSDVSSILRARTYSKGVVDPEEPLKAVAGGSLEGEFSSSTRPTADELRDKLIPQASLDLLTAVGVVPGLFLDRARRIAALRVAAEIERSFIPEQSEGKGAIYQTLRMTYDEEVEKLQTTLQWWALSRILRRRHGCFWAGWNSAIWDWNPWWWSPWP